MSFMQLETVVHHDGRLNILCCLVDNGDQSIPQLAARTGDSQQAVHYWVRVLENFDLVKQVGEEGRQRRPVYSVSLDGHPQWVREAVEDHRPRTI
ncbi:MAG TPA: winged helix-turn-helix domain-containing protein [Solirubrobacterales bacterium]|nr:winged helix-turn-helix domain-containing protein [Solirubrobacterales bacterium]